MEFLKDSLRKSLQIFLTLSGRKGVVMGVWPPPFLTSGFQENTKTGRKRGGEGGLATTAPYVRFPGAFLSHGFAKDSLANP